MNTTLKCSACDGMGKQRVMVVTYSEGKQEGRSVPITCIACNGSGSVTQEQQERIKRIREMWCCCGKSEEGVTFHSDTTESKHHWTCNHCGKITQIG